MKKFVFSSFLCLITLPVFGNDILSITCENKAQDGCTLSENLAPIHDCSKISVTETDYAYIDSETHNKCEKQIEAVTRGNKKCPAVQVVMIDIGTGNVKKLLYCITNQNVVVKYTDDPTDTWSYAHKQCVGSWGIWENNRCKCDHLEGAQTVENECQCTNNSNQKYYNKMVSGCATLENNVKQAGTNTILIGFDGFDLKDVDKLNSCPPSGGIWGGAQNNVCTCSPDLNLKPDDTGYFCNCKEGYDYLDPMGKTNGCVPISQIDDINESTTSTSDTPTDSENVAPASTDIPTEQTLTAACTYSGGEYQNGECVCDADKHLEEYKPENAPEYSICRCMYGYKRKGGTLGEDGKTITEYPDGAECEYAGTETIEKVFDSVKWRKDTENAYKHERDNTQSWANKGITAGSTLLTGEGAMMAAQAWAEQNADKRAEEQMNAYITTMKCEYGGGQQVDLGKEETLPGGNELSKNYTEYKQLADKLKAIKTALNMRPGIESEVLYEKAETGLYNYQTAERQSGTYASVARALMDTTGTDAERWNAQRAETAQNLKTGALLAAGGVATGVVGNYLVNRNHKNEYMNLEKEFNEISRYLETEYPEIFIPKEEPTQKENMETIAIPPKTTVSIDQTNSEELPSISDEAFEPGSIELTQKGQEAVTKAATAIANLFDQHNIKSITVTATGYTDPQNISPQTADRLTKEYKNLFGNLPNKYNEKIDENSELSEVRAKMVLKSLTEQLEQQNITVTESTAKGGGISEDCALGNNIKKKDYKKCRKIEVTINYTYIKSAE